MADEQTTSDVAQPAAEQEAPPQPAAAPVADAPVDAQPGTPDVGDAEVDADLAQLRARASERDEYLALAQRTRADLENYRRRVVRDAAAAESRAVVRLVRELLPALDNLERALAAATSDGPGGQLLEGMRLVRDDLGGALGRAGVERFDSQGERFDPELHEAIAQHPVPGAEPGTVVEVYQAGYRMNGSLVRPARVVVAATPPPPPAAAPEPSLDDRGS